MYFTKSRNIFILSLLSLALFAAGCHKDPQTQKREFTASGDKLAASQKYQDAIIQYRNALKADPNASDVYYKLGEAYFRNNQLREAFGAYKRATELDKNNVPAQLAVARFYLVSQQFDEVMRIANNILANQPDNIDASMLLANAFVGKKDTAQGIKILQDVVAKHPESVPAHLNLGVFYASKGQTDAEREQFEAAVKADPKSVEAHKALAAYYSSQKDESKAEQELKAAVDASGGSVAAKQSLAEFYFRQKRYPEAEAAYKDLVTAQKNSPQSRFTLAGFYLTQGKPDEAKKIDEQLAKDSPTFIPARLQVAELALSEHKLDDAEKVVNDILKDRSKEPQALTLHAQILLERGGQPQKALEDLETAQKFEPKMPTIYYLQGLAYGQMGNMDHAQSSLEQAISYDPNYLKAYLSLAEMMLNRNQSEASLRYSEQVLQKAPDNVLALFLEGNAYANLRDYTKAQAAFTKYEQLAPSSSQGPLRMGMVELSTKKFDAAEKDFEKALQMNPKEYDALDDLAALYFIEKKPEKAVARVQQQLQTDKSATVYKVLGKAQAQAGDKAAAEQSFKQAIALQPQDYTTHLLLGQLYATDKSLDKALTEYDQATKERPNDAGLWTLFGMLNEQAGHQDVAKKAYEKALEIAPTSGGAANNLAWMYMTDNNKDLDKALELARTAKIALPQAAPVSDTLGWVYYNRKLYESALPLIQEAVKEQPQKAEYHFHLAAVLMETGRKPQAKAELNTALKLDAKLKDREDVKKVMGALGV